MRLGSLYLPHALSVIVWLAIAAFSASAHAEANDYKSLTQAAVEEHSLGHYEEARSLFAKAHAINPNARTLWGMGVATFEARRYTEAIELLRAALDDPRKPLTAAQRKEAESLIERSESFIARVPMRITPTSASIVIDGRAVSPDADGFIMLDTGVHQVVVSADGYNDVVRSMRWDAGVAPVFQVELETRNTPEPAPSSGPAMTMQTASGPTVDRSSGGPRSYQVLKWVSLGMTVAAGGLTGGALVLRNEAAQTWNNETKCPEPMAETCAGTRDAHNRWRAIAIAAGAGTAVFAALSITFFVLDRPAADRAQHARASCSPLLLPGAVCRVQF